MECGECTTAAPCLLVTSVTASGIIWKKCCAPWCPTGTCPDTLQITTILSLRNTIAEAMVWCIEHAESGEEIIECLAESLSILEVSSGG